MSFDPAEGERVFRAWLAAGGELPGGVVPGA